MGNPSVGFLQYEEITPIMIAEHKNKYLIFPFAEGGKMRKIK